MSPPSSGAKENVWRVSTGHSKVPFWRSDKEGGGLTGVYAGRTRVRTSFRRVIRHFWRAHPVRALIGVSSARKRSLACERHLRGVRTGLRSPDRGRIDRKEAGKPEKAERTPRTPSRTSGGDPRG